MRNGTYHAQTLAPGRAFSGSVIAPESFGQDAPARDAIFVVNRLHPQHHAAIRSAQGIICEEGSESDPASMYCRTAGVPLMKVPDARASLKPGAAVTLDPSNGSVHLGHVRLPRSLPFSSSVYLLPETLAHNQLDLQVGILDATDIQYVNRNPYWSPDAASFFLREEFIWTGSGILDPFHYAHSHGVSAAKDFLKDAFSRCLEQMKPGQTLNVRALDMCSDELPLSDRAERNPDLGLHGVRRLLKDNVLLVAELRALAELRAAGYTNIVFSLPFINDCNELDRVAWIAQNQGAQDVPLGVFIETAAAVAELPFFLERGVRHVYIAAGSLSQMILACDRSSGRGEDVHGVTKRPVVETIRRIVQACQGRDVSLILFSMIEKAQFFLYRFPELTGIEVSCGDYRLLGDSLRPAESAHRAA